MRLCDLYTFLLLLAPPAFADVVVDTPHRLVLPDAVHARWATTEGLRPFSAAERGVAVQIGAELHLPARLDLFSLVDGVCVWRAAFTVSTPSVTFPASESCVLIREGAKYAFTIVRPSDARIDAPVLWDVAVPTEHGRHALYVMGEPEPRLRTRAGRFEAVPARPALLCTFGGEAGEECAVVGQTEAPAVRGHLRIFRVEEEGFRVAAWRKSSSPLPLLSVPLHVQSAGEWYAVSSERSWEEVVLDWTRTASALVRFDGTTTARLPHVDVVRATDTDGVRVRAILSDGSALEPEAEARLLVFLDPPPRDAVPAAVLAATDGVFHAPHLAPSHYTVQLMSAFSTEDRVRVPLRSDVTDVRVTAGVLVRGRVVLRGATPTASAPTVQVVRKHRRSGSGDAAQHEGDRWARQVTPDASGVFRLAMTPGSYALRATWAGLVAEREFSVAETKIDLGDIDLRAAPL